MREFTETETRTFTIACPKGDGGDIVKVGKQSGHQRYKCKTCGTYFRDQAHIGKGKQYPVEQVGAALGWYFDGLSYREVARNMARHFKIPEPAEETIYRWVQAYAEDAVEAVKDNKAKTGTEWVADETKVKIDGEPYWLWNVMDAKTRFILAAYITHERDLKAATKVMKMARELAANPPETIRTDRLPAYPRAIKIAFGKGNIEHIQTDGIAAVVNNNLSERLQGTIKERNKVLRGFKRPASAQQYLDGWVLDYNYFRPHHALGKVRPASKAGVEAPFDNWQGVAHKVRAKGKDRTPRARDLPGFKPKKKLGRPITKPRGRAALEARPIDEPVKTRAGRPRPLVAHNERPPSQASLDTGKR